MQPAQPLTQLGGALGLRDSAAASVAAELQVGFIRRSSNNSYWQYFVRAYCGISSCKLWSALCPQLRISMRVLTSGFVRRVLNWLLTHLPEQAYFSLPPSFLRHFCPLPSPPLLPPVMISSSHQTGWMDMLWPLWLVCDPCPSVDKAKATESHRAPSRPHSHRMTPRRSTRCVSVEPRKDNGPCKAHVVAPIKLSLLFLGDKVHLCACHGTCLSKPFSCMEKKIPTFACLLCAALFLCCPQCEPEEETSTDAVRECGAGERRLCVVVPNEGNH